MNNEVLKGYFKGLGWTVETVEGQDHNRYIVVSNYVVPTGKLGGRTCDVAIQYTNSVPYVAPAAIHTRPALVPMDMNAYKTQNSGIGPEWQYWSRVLRCQPTPRAFITHIATIFSEVNL